MSPSGTVPGSAQADKDHTFVAIDNNSNNSPTIDSSNDKSGNSAEDIDGDYGSYGDHVFADPKVAAYWADIYDKAKYEGRHRFDPEFTWSATEEKRLKRKVGDVVAPSGD